MKNLKITATILTITVLLSIMSVPVFASEEDPIITEESYECEDVEPVDSDEIFELTEDNITVDVESVTVDSCLTDEYVTDDLIVEETDSWIESSDLTTEIVIDQNTFPDANFRDYVLTEIDKDDSGSLSEEEIANTTEIYLGGNEDCSYNDIRGIEFFTDLRYLSCSNYDCDGLREIDLSSNINLEELCINDNQLESLDLSHNTALSVLICSSNQLTTLDLSNNPELTGLNCDSNRLTSLDLSNNNKLWNVYCNNNELSSLILGNNNALTFLVCYNNNLTTIDISGCSKFVTICLAGNDVYEYSNTPVFKWYGYGINNSNGYAHVDLNVTLIFFGDDFPDGVISIDAVNFPDENFRNYVLERLNYDSDPEHLTPNEISLILNIDVSDKSITCLQGVEFFTSLTTLDCSNNQLSSIDLSRNTDLTYLSCSNNQLEDLDLSNNTALYTLICSNNQLEYLDLSNNPNLSTLECYDNEISSLDFSNNPSLREVIDLGRKIYSDSYLEFYYFNNYNPRIVYVDLFTMIDGNLDINSITFPDFNFQLYIKNNYDLNSNGMLSQAERDAVEYIDVSRRGITSLQGIGFFLSLKSLICVDNQLSVLDVSNNPDLYFLDCQNNSITEIIGLNNTDMYILLCTNNMISSIDVTQCVGIEVLVCSGNKIQTLDISNNTMLKNLQCDNNQISVLDITNNPSLVQAYVYGERRVIDSSFINYYYEELDAALSVDPNVTVVSSSIVAGWNRLDDGSYIYINEDGTRAIGWQLITDKHYYFDSNGIMLTGWQKISGKWYFFNSNGVLQYGWQKVNNKWYFFNRTNGAMTIGWQKIDSKWYYFASSGAMSAGWTKVGGKWYYFNSSGAMLTGWQNISGKWYYFESSGAMKTGWLKSGGKWYYFESSGAMLANTTRRISGKNYSFNSSGVCTNP